MNYLRSRYLLWGFLVVALVGVLGTTFWSKLRTLPRQGSSDPRPLEGLRSFGVVPDFSLIERSGKPIKLSDLHGKVWIASFIYTTCKETCPVQSAEMAKLQADLKERQNFRLVSISVDPERDTPQALSLYADQFKADPDRWLFLTGQRKEIRRLAQEGFRLSAVPVSRNSGSDGNVIFHSSRLVLVDPKKEIRGYYDSSDSESLLRLNRDLKTLLRKDWG